MQVSSLSATAPSQSHTSSIAATSIYDPSSPYPIIISNDPPPPSHPALPPGSLKAAETLMSVVSFASFSSIEVTIALVALRMALFFRITLLLTGAVCAGAVEYDH